MVEQTAARWVAWKAERTEQTKAARWVDRLVARMVVHWVACLADSTVVLRVAHLE